MKRITKTAYCNDQGLELLVLSGGKATISRSYHDHNRDDLYELARACEAAAEELRSLASVEVGDEL